MKKKIAIIGGGIAGLAIARDLNLRGFNVTIIDQAELGSGTTTKCAGMLHSGARYAIKDQDIARVCYLENTILATIAPFAVGTKKAFFITVHGDDEKYHKDFESSCEKLGIPVNFLTKGEVLKVEPLLNKNITGAYETPDLVVHTFMLVSAYISDLKKRGVEILEDTEVTKAKFSNNKWELVVKGKDKENKIDVDFVINSTGDGVADVAKLFGANISLTFIHGTMAVVNKPISKRIISRCAPSTTGDVIVPLTDSTLIGSTWHELDNHNPIEMNEEDKNALYESADLMLEKSNEYKIISHFTGIRTHIKNSSEHGDFNVKRDYSITNSNVPNFLSVLPGKLTIARYVAEKTVDEICKNFDLDIKCKTATTLLDKPENFENSKLKFYVK